MALVRRVDFKGAIISFAEKISYFKKHSMMMLHKLFQSTEQDEKLSTAFVLRVFNAFFFTIPLKILLFLSSVIQRVYTCNYFYLSAFLKLLL